MKKNLLLFAFSFFCFSSIAYGLDLEEKNQNMLQLHREVEDIREFYRNDPNVEWYTDFFVHARNELLKFTGFSIFKEDFGTPIEEKDLYPALKAIIEYRKIVTSDFTELDTTATREYCFGYELNEEDSHTAFFDYLDNIYNGIENPIYVYAYINKTSPIQTCPPFRDGGVQRKWDLHRIINAALPEVEHPLQFALENNIVSDTYFTEENQYLPINRAEFSKIVSGLLDYIWENRESLKTINKETYWYEEYFLKLKSYANNYYYNLSEFPAEPVANFEIYKLISSDILAYYPDSSDYVCNEADFIFSQDVYRVHRRLGIAQEDRCVAVERNYKLSREEAVKLLMSVYYPDREDITSFCVKNGIFSDEYLKGDNKEIRMNHAELAKIYVKMYENGTGLFDDFGYLLPLH